MPEMLGFWSYVHADDEADAGFVADLARDLAARYQMIRNEPVELFLDRDDLAWGDRWRDRIDSTLSNIAFFVPIITPRYFASTECRRELEFFLNRARTLGIEALVLPILYETVPGLLDENAADPLLTFVRESNWRDWRELRFEDRGSGSYRRAVHELAAEVARRAEAVAAIDIVPAVEAAEASGAFEDAPGTLDTVAELEVAMPEWGNALTDVATELGKIGEIMRNATQAMQADTAQGKGFAARLVIARRVAVELADPVEAIERLVNFWLGRLETIDKGIRALVMMVESDASVSPQQVDEFFESLNFVAETARENLTKSLLMVEQLDVLAKQSRDLRPMVQRLREPLVAMAEATKVTSEWATLRAP